MSFFYDRKKNSDQTGILKIILIYMITGGLWIKFSDALITRFTTNIDVLTRIATAKGWLFILVTSFLLYYLIRKYVGEKMEAIEHMQESERRYKDLADLLPETVFEADLEGNFTFANLATYNTFGYSQEEVSNDFSVFKAVSPEDIEKTKIYVSKIINIKSNETAEYMAMRKDGTTFPAIISSSPIIKDNVVTGIRGIVLDISDRKIIEEQLRKLSRAVEQSPASIIITNLEGSIEYVNPRFVESSGYLFQEVKGKNPSILKSGNQSQMFYKNLWDTITSGNEWRGEFHNMKKDGSLYWESASISSIKNSAGIMTHFLAIKEDITEKKIIENELIHAKVKAEESDRLKSEFLAQMSHEIRTPLNVIMSYNSFLKDELTDNLNEDQLNAFAAVNSAGRRLFRTIDLILNMAELQTGNIDIKFSNINIYYILKGLIKEFEHAASEKKLDINCIITCETPPVVRTDEYIISEVFQNLIDNAIKYTVEGHIDINVYKDENNNCCVSVKDTGIGISEDYIEKIFLPFSQEESGYSRKYEGNGLGLALVKNYLKLINADIRVESEKGIGSNFIVNFN